MLTTSPISPSWLKYLHKEFTQPYMQNLQKFLQCENQQYVVYPEDKLRFHALNICPIENTKIVIIGQDPYHGKNQAHGLAFSVQQGVKIPPSLRNIYKEIESSLHITMSQNGDLSNWAKQGVLLINATLSVRHATPQSHAKKGWQKFTDCIIHTVNDKCDHIIFMLWGKPAQQKLNLINTKKHLVLQAPHPSPLSAYRGFFGCNHFKLANQYLQKHQKTPINWQV